MNTETAPLLSDCIADSDVVVSESIKNAYPLLSDCIDDSDVDVSESIKNAYKEEKNDTFLPRVLIILLWKGLKFQKTQKCMIITQLIIYTILFTGSVVIISIYSNISAAVGDSGVVPFYSYQVEPNSNLDNIAVIDPDPSRLTGNIDIGWASCDLMYDEYGSYTYTRASTDGLLGQFPLSIYGLYDPLHYTYNYTAIPFIAEDRLADNRYDLEEIIYEASGSNGDSYYAQYVRNVPITIFDISEFEGFVRSEDTDDRTLKTKIDLEISVKPGDSPFSTVLAAVTGIYRSFLKTLDPDMYIYSYTLETQQYSIKVGKTSMDGDFLGISILFGIVALPIIANLCKEHDYGVKELLRLAGVREREYHVAWMLSNGVVAMILLSFAYLIGYFIFHLNLYRDNSFYAVLALMLAWSVALPAYCSLLTTITRKGALPLTILLLFGAPVLTMVLTTSSRQDNWWTYPLDLLVPFCAMSKGVSYLTQAAVSFTGGARPTPRVHTSGLFTDEPGFWVQILILLVSAVVWQYAAILLSVLRGEEGRKGAKVFGKRPLPPVNALHPPNPDANVKREAELVARLFEGDQSAPVADGMPVMVARGLTKTFSDIVAVDHVSFVVERGSCFGLLGANGAGKSTLLNMISGLLDCTEGHVYIRGDNVAADSAVTGASIGVCPQHDRVWPELTVYDHIYLFTYLKTRIRGRTALDTAVKDTLLKVGLRHIPTRHAGGLSGGMRRRLALGIAICGNPSLLALDEVTCGLDPANKRDIIDVIRPLKKEMAIILTTHNMEDAEELCDRITIMHKGRLALLDSYGQLLSALAPAVVGKFQLEQDADPAVFERVMRESLGDAVRDIEIRHDGYCSANFPQDSGLISSVFDLLVEHQARLGVNSFTLGSLSLQDLFCVATAELDARDMERATSLDTAIELKG